jgi:putative SOS response-associated peptidase YedK
MLRSVTILSTTLNQLCADIHDRILLPETWPVWLEEEPVEPDALTAGISGEQGRHGREGKLARL